MTFKTTLMAGTVLGALALAAGSAAAQTPGAPQAQMDSLNRQIQALQAQIKALEEKVTRDHQAIDRRVTDLPRVTVDNGRPRFRTPASATQQFDVALRTRLHFDTGYWFPDTNFAADPPDGFNIRRAFLGVAGTVFNDWAFNINADFSGTRGGAARLQEASLSFTGFKGWALDIGALQPSFTLEDSISSNDIPFIERSSPVNVAVSQVASESRTVAGFRHWGDNYRVSAYLTGSTLGTAAGPDDQASFIGRASFRPWTSNDGDLHVGANYGYMWEPQAPAGANQPRTVTLSERPETRIGGGTVQLVSTGAVDTDDFAVYGGELGLTYKSFWAMGEWYYYEIDQRLAGRPDLDFTGYYLAGGYFLTGERRQYSVQNGNFGGPRVQWPFRVSGGHGTGAWEIAFRYSSLDLTDENIVLATEGEQEVMTFGLNWYANAAIRFMFNYQNINVDRPVGQDTEGDALTARMQFQF